MPRCYRCRLPHAWQKCDDFPQGGNLAVTNAGDTISMAMNYDGRFDQIDAKFKRLEAKIDTKIDQVLDAVLGLKQSTEEHFIRLEGRQDKVEVRLDRVESRLTSIE